MLVIGSFAGSAPPAATRMLHALQPAEPAAAWSFCSNVGALCEFVGARDVRLVAKDGAAVVQRRFGSIACGQYAFQLALPPASLAQRCEIGPMLTDVVLNPLAGRNGLAASVVVPRGDDGFGAERMASTNLVPIPSPGEGTFRTQCNMTRMMSADPIVFPGQPSAGALKVFFGNGSIASTSTPLSISTTGNSTCVGGTVNRSAYWLPAMVDAATGEVQAPRAAAVHYGTGYNLDPALIQPAAAGLRVLAGDPSATMAQDGAPHYAVEWGCEVAYASAGDGFIPDCPVGDAVQLRIVFPQCWNGRTLDSPDHRQHMTYAVYRRPPARSSCPASHPVQVPTVSITVTYPVAAAAHPLRWRLSSDTSARVARGGLSAHAAMIDGWSRGMMNTIVQKCLNAQQDCRVGLTGDGHQLVYQDR